MPPVVSKPASAIASIDPTCTANSNFSASSGSLVCEENQNFVDPNLAHIISNVVSNVISNSQKTLRKKKELANILAVCVCKKCEQKSKSYCLF